MSGLPAAFPLSWQQVRPLGDVLLCTEGGGHQVYRSWLPWPRRGLHHQGSGERRTLIATESSLVGHSVGHAGHRTIVLFLQLQLSNDGAAVLTTPSYAAICLLPWPRIRWRMRSCLCDRSCVSALHPPSVSMWRAFCLSLSSPSTHTWYALRHQPPLQVLSPALQAPQTQPAPLQAARPYRPQHPLPPAQPAAAQALRQQRHSHPYPAWRR